MVGDSRIALTAAGLVCATFAAGIMDTPRAFAASDSVAEFYKGKQIRGIIRSSGSYDLYTRLLGTHIVRHIPGNPSFLPVNMPGAGGLLALNWVGNIGPKDGTILTIPSSGLPMYQALDFYGDKLKVDLRELFWIGNLTDSNPVLTTWHTSKVKTLEDAKQHVAIMGTTGAGSISAQLPAVYNNLLGTKFKVIYGYDGNDTVLAMERGEIDGRASNTWASYNAVLPDWVKNKRLNYILQIGLKKEQDLPEVPLLTDLADNDEERQIFEFFSRVVAISRAIVTSPGVPPERVTALRRAFDATMKDPEFLATVEKANAEISPMSGEDVQRTITDTINTPKPLLEKVRQAMELKPGDAEERKK